jgi:hypothetical protein
MIAYNPPALEPQRRPAAGVLAGGMVRPAGRSVRREARADRGSEFLAALEETSRAIKGPVAKLRYIRGSVQRYARVQRAVEALPWEGVRRLLYRWLSLESLRQLMTANPNGSAVVSDAARRSVARSRWLAAAAAAVAASAATSIPLLWPARAPAAAPAPEPAALPRVAEALSPLPEGMGGGTVWIVERGDGWEQLSNGLRIDITHAVPGEPRRYRSFDRRSGEKSAVRGEPAGILFHTSESDIWPLDAANNEKLRESSRRLLLYVQRLKLYHYLVDRFGRAYRIVEEEAKANHAGNSIWEHDGQVYLNLNHAFLGICFETRWEGGRALPITAAQLAAGRSLTEHLRQRWRVPPAMCTAHGLTSVNPGKRLIGHHVDWARGFPFEAFGLPDQYRRPAPSVALFGFGYDGDLVKAMGEPWPGVREAERALAAEAAREGKTLEALRRERQAAYDRWREEQTRDEEATASRRAAVSTTIGG